MPFDITNLSDVENAFIEKMADCVYHVTVDPDGVHLTFGGYDYSVERSRVNTSEKLLGWVCHLTDKTWIDMVRLRFIIEKVARDYELLIDKRM